MATNAPNLDAGPVRLSPLRDEARKALVDAIDQRRGKKALVLDPHISGFLGVFAEVSLLREHGVEQLFHLGTESLADVTAKTVVYLISNRIDTAQQVARHIREGIRSGISLEYLVLFVPCKGLVCERVFQEEGVYGDVTLAEVALQAVPLDNDVLSLELDYGLQEMLLEGDRSCLFYTARLLMKLQSLYGLFPYLAGKGPAAAAVRDMLLRMRLEHSTEPTPTDTTTTTTSYASTTTTDAAVDLCIMVDRAVDLVTPLMTQLTYEGLIDEVLGIRNATVSIEGSGQGAQGSGSAPPQRQKVLLNSSDRVFHQLRDRSFAAVGPWLAERTKGLQSEYQDTRSGEKSLVELKNFASQLKALPSLSRHIHLAEQLTKTAGMPSFRQRVQTEQELVDGNAADVGCEAAADLIHQGAPLQSVLRMLCLVSMTQGGIPKRQFDPLRKELLIHYGYQHILTLTALQDAGLLRSSSTTKNTFPPLRKALGLLVPDINERDPEDIAYTYAGYAPMSVRMVEGFLQQGWGAMEDALRHVQGPSILVKQGMDQQGRPIAPAVQGGRLPWGTSSAPSDTIDSPRVVLVVFLGGATHAEINALRFLQSQPGYPYRFVVVTTRMLSGNSLMDGFALQASKYTPEG